MTQDQAQDRSAVARANGSVPATPSRPARSAPARPPSCSESDPSGINSGAGLVPYLAARHIAAGMNWPVFAVFALAAVVVSLPAGRLARCIPAAALRRGFAVLVLLVAAGVITQAIASLTA